MLKVLSRFGGHKDGLQKSVKFINNNSWRDGSVTCLLKRSYSYEGDGKTTVTVINQEPDAPLMIDAYSPQGFRLNNGMHVIGPMAVFPKTVLAWNIKDSTGINLKSLSLFFSLVPRLDILIVGCGDNTRGISREVLREIRSQGVNMEILSTDHACTTFNFLNAERRAVAAALIPPTKITFVDEDILQSQKRRNILWKDTED